MEPYQGLGTAWRRLLAAGAATLLVVCSVASAQEDAEERSGDEQARAEPALPETKTYVDLPRIIVEEADERWRLPEDLKQEIWQREIDEVLREREREARRRDGALVTVGEDGRLRFEILPVYDPESARDIDMQIDGAHTEVIDLFRVKF